MKRILSLLLAAALLPALLSGCFFRSAEELYTLPRLTDDYSNLRSKLEEAIASGLEYAAPLTGTYTQIVQLQDLDGDGTDEAVAFFRDSSATEKSLKIYIFRQDQDGLYEMADVIEGDGTAISSIYYTDLDGENGLELVVNWQASAGVYSVVAYALEVRGPGYSHTELMRSGCSRYVVRDMDQDNCGEVVLLHLDSSEDSSSRAEYYDWVDGSMAMLSVASLSVDMTSISRVRYHYLRDFVPALFVTGTLGDGRTVTDILMAQDGELNNITLDPEVGSSLSTLSSQAAGDQVFPWDINGDAVYELPFPRPMVTVSPSEQEYYIDWVQYDVSGTGYLACTTYHSIDGWYLTLPSAWQENIAAIHRSPSSGEQSVTFYYMGGVEAEAFLTIYTLTGSNREVRSRARNRQVLITGTDTIYAAEFLSSGWYCGLDKDTLLERFSLIPTDWSD